MKGKGNAPVTPWSSRPILTSPQNPKVRAVARLRKRQERDELGLTLVDGCRELACAVHAGQDLQQLFICEAMLDQESIALAAEVHESRGEVIPVSPDLMDRMSYGDRNEGLLAVIRKPNVSLDRLPANECPLLLIVEGLEKPGNLGALLRSADAAGATGVIVCHARTDIFNPNAIRSSLGTIFSVPLAEAQSSAALKWLRERSIAVYAATPHASRPYTSLDFTGPCAVVLGSEQAGLTDLWMNEAVERLVIPMRGRADSLNLAMSASVLLFEAARQRDVAGRD